MRSAELFQARRWRQIFKVVLVRPAFLATFLATLSIVLKDFGMTICQPKVFPYPEPDSQP